MLCYGIADKYISLKNNKLTIQAFDVQTASTSMSYKDVVYKNTNGVPLSLDIYEPIKQVYKS